LLTQAGIAPAN